MKYVVRKRKPIPFSWRFEVEMMRNKGDFCEEHSGFEKRITGEDNEQLQHFEGKLKKVLKNWLIYAKHAIFTTRLSHEQVARTLKTKILKNFLSDFRDWKFYPRGSRKISRENPWVPSQLEPPPTNKSPI